MTDFVIPQASLFLGVIPALILLYISLKGYEGHYKDKIIFLSFVVGIILGFVAAFVQFVQSLTYLAIIYIILLAFFDQLLKTIVLNIGRLQRKRETPIYGLTLGLGFGSAFTPFHIIAVSRLITSDVYILSLIAIGSLGIILFHGATGAYIGYGIYAGKLTKHLLAAVIVQLPFNLIIAITIFFSNPKSPDFHLGLVVGLVIGIVVYGSIVFWYVLKKIMPQILPQSRGRKRLKRSSN